MALDETGKVSARQPQGFEELFLSEWPRVARVAQQITRSSAQGEEVAQEVFLAFYRRFGEAWPEHPAAWLCRAAAHTALNAVRGEGRRRAREDREGRSAAAPAADPGELLAAREEARALRGALGRLREEQATLLALRYSGFSYNEIAQVTGTPIGQIGTRLRRAELALRKEYGDAAR